MTSRWMKASRCTVTLAAFLVGCSLYAMPIHFQDTQSSQADNTKQNKDQSKPTADQQNMNSSDRAITRKIRQALHSDSSLSTYAHNIKIVSQDGKVTLRGPVRSDEEKNEIEAKAVEVAGQGNVTNELKVAPPKN